MPIYPQEEDQRLAMAAVHPLLANLDDAWRGALARYHGEGYSDAVRAEHSVYAMRRAVYDHAETRMLEIVEEVDGLVAINLKGMTVFNYRDQAVVRLKKVNPEGKHCNYPTGQQLDYDCQLELPGLPPAFRLVAGYSPDPSDTYVERFMITRPIGRKPYWTAQVNLHEGEPSWEDITPPAIFGNDLSHLTPTALLAMRRRYGP